jgi:hypothetical protein
MVKPFTWKTFEFFSSKPLHIGKAFISFGLCFYFLVNLYLFLVKPFQIGKGSNSSWLNLYILAKLPSFHG